MNEMKFIPTDFLLHAAGRKLSGGAFRVLIALCHRADNETFLAWPSVASVAETTGQCKRSVLRAFSELLAEGLLEDTGDRKGRGVIVYRLTTSDKSVTSDKSFTSDKPVTSGVTRVSPVPVTNLSPGIDHKGKTTENDHKQTPRALRARSSAEADRGSVTAPLTSKLRAQVREAWEHHKQARIEQGFQVNARKPTPKDMEQGVAALRRMQGSRESPLETLMAASDWMVRSPHHRGENDRRTVYLSWDLLCRKCETYEDNALAETGQANNEELPF